ncbi:trifunctional dihydropteroate synthetase, partial [Kickxella alabastrina]
MADKIIFRDLEVRTVLGSDAWERKKPQPLLITVEIHTSITSAGKTDKVTESVHYGIACKRATSFAESEHKLQSLEAFAEGVAHACLGVTTRALAVHVIVNKPRALLHAECAGVEIFRTRKELLGSWGDDLVPGRDESPDAFARRSAFVAAERADAENSAGRLAKEDRIIVKTLSLSTIIGVNLWERHYKQVVNFDLVLHSEKPAVLGAAVSDTVPRYRNFRTVVDVVTELVEKSSYRTVEALATAIARTAIKQCKVPKITVRVEKPNALVFAACSAVEITRSVDDFPTVPDARNTPIGSPTPVRAATPAADSPSIGGFDAATAASTQASPVLHSAFIALGTNVGDRLANLHKALAYLNADLPTSHVAETSFLYETAPMYVTDQPA